MFSSLKALVSPSSSSFPILALAVLLKIIQALKPKGRMAWEAVVKAHNEAGEQRRRAKPPLSGWTRDYESITAKLTKLCSRDEKDKELHERACEASKSIIASAHGSSLKIPVKETSRPSASSALQSSPSASSGVGPVESSTTTRSMSLEQRVRGQRKEKEVEQVEQQQQWTRWEDRGKGDRLTSTSPDLEPYSPPSSRQLYFDGEFAGEPRAKRGGYSSSGRASSQHSPSSFEEMEEDAEEEEEEATAEYQDDFEKYDAKGKGKTSSKSAASIDGDVDSRADSHRAASPSLPAGPSGAVSTKVKSKARSLREKQLKSHIDPGATSDSTTKSDASEGRKVKKDIVKQTVSSSLAMEEFMKDAKVAREAQREVAKALLENTKVAREDAAARGTAREESTERFMALMTTFVTTYTAVNRINTDLQRPLAAPELPTPGIGEPDSDD